MSYNIMYRYQHHQKGFRYQIRSYLMCSTLVEIFPNPILWSRKYFNIICMLINSLSFVSSSMISSIVHKRSRHWSSHDDVIKWEHFRVIDSLCGEFTGLRWIPLTKASDAEFDFSLIFALNKRWSKQSRGWWFQTPLCSLWRHCNVNLWCWLSATGSASDSVLPVVWND